MTEELFKYLEGDLSESEKDALEKLLEKNPELKEKLKLCKNVNEFLSEAAAYEEAKEKAQKIRDAYEESESRSLPFVAKGLRVAAALVLLISGLWLVHAYVNSPAKFYADNFTEWTPKNITRGDNNRFVVEWVNNYSNKDYQAAVEAFATMPETYKTDPQLQIMYCNALMHLAMYEKAILTLDAIDISTQSVFEDAIDWYKALCYIKLKQNDNADILFSKLTGSDQYRESAEKALKTLD